MTDRELRQMSRKELLELLIEQTEENERLKAQLEAANQQLSERKLMIEKVGSLAEAALALNGVFAAADAAAKQFLESVEASSQGQKQGSDAS